MGYTLDTNTIVYHLSGDESVRGLLDDLLSQGSQFYVSTIVEAELFRYPDLTLAEYNAIHAYLQTVSILPVDSHLAQLSGALGRTYGLKLADSIIAATALYTGSTIVTRNTRDFKKVANLEILSI